MWVLTLHSSQKPDQELPCVDWRSAMEIAIRRANNGLKSTIKRRDLSRSY